MSEGETSQQVRVSSPHELSAQLLDTTILKYILQFMQTTVIFKADKKLKEAAQKTAKKMGIPFSAVMNRLMNEFVDRQHISFSTESYEPTPYLKRILEKGEKDLKAGKNITYFNSVEELMADLNS